jgi:cyclase
MDAVASLYGRNSLHEIVASVANNVFVPLTVGGGLRNVEDVRAILRVGADKVAINTAAIQRPELIEELAVVFGSQCIVLSIEAKRQPAGSWEAYVENGRERTGRDAVDWARQGVDLGAGEILLTSIDREGTRKGFDCELVRAVADSVDVPVVASGGMGSPQDLVNVVSVGHADAVAMADILHYERFTIEQVRDLARQSGLDVRQIA